MAYLRPEIITHFLLTIFVVFALNPVHGYQTDKPTTTRTFSGKRITSGTPSFNPKQPKQEKKNNLQSRKQFNNIINSTFWIFPFTLAKDSNAFEGGVGGLGKTKPNTGVQFANPDIIPDISSISIPGYYNAELVDPNGNPVFLSFYAAWPMLKSQGIESRDLANAESAFVQVARRPENYSGILKKEFFVESIFGQTGKFGAYGEPTDVKVSKVDSNLQRDLYLVSFTTLTPAMRESDRKIYISAKVVQNSVFMLITGTTMGRFRSQEVLLKRIADSFECLEAPKSNLRK